MNPINYTREYQSPPPQSAQPYPDENARRNISTYGGNDDDYDYGYSTAASYTLNQVPAVPYPEFADSRESVYDRKVANVSLTDSPLITALLTKSHEQEISFPSPRGDGKDISMVKESRFDEARAEVHEELPEPPAASPAVFSFASIQGKRITPSASAAGSFGASGEGPSSSGSCGGLPGTCEDKPAPGKVKGRAFKDKSAPEYRRYRDKNNIAVAKCREKKKQQEQVTKALINQLRSENSQLNDRIRHLETEIAILRNLCRPSASLDWDQESLQEAKRVVTRPKKSSRGQKSRHV